MASPITINPPTTDTSMIAHSGKFEELLLEEHGSKVRGTVAGSVVT